MNVRRSTWIPFAAVAAAVTAVTWWGLRDTSEFAVPEHVTIAGRDVTVDGVMHLETGHVFTVDPVDPDPPPDVGGTPSPLTMREEPRILNLRGLHPEHTVYIGDLNSRWGVVTAPTTSEDSLSDILRDWWYDTFVERQPPVVGEAWHDTWCIYLSIPGQDGPYQCQVTWMPPFVARHDPTIGYWAAWLGVPDGTAVVEVREDGRPLVWQAPTAHVVVFDLPDDRTLGSIELVALDGEGNQIEVGDLGRPHETFVVVGR